MTIHRMTQLTTVYDYFKTKAERIHKTAYNQRMIGNVGFADERESRANRYDRIAGKILHRLETDIVE
jgi:hypothetical protein